MAVLRRMLSHRKEGETFRDFTARRVIYNQNLHAFDISLNISACILMAIATGGFFYGSKFSNTFIIVQRFVIVAALMNMTVKAGGNSTTGVLMFVIILVMVLISLPGVMDLLKTIIDALKQGVQAATTGSVPSD